MKKKINEKQLQIVLSIVIIIALSFECLFSVLEQTRIYLGLIELGSVMLPMFAIVALFVSIAYTREKKTINKANLFLTILLAVSVLISFFVAEDKNAAISGHNLHSEGVMVCLSYAIFFYAGTLFCDEKVIKTLYRGISFIAVFQVIWGAMQTIIQPFFLHDFLSNLYYPSYRAAGTMENPNCYGSFLVIVLGIETILFWNSIERRKNILHGFLIVIYSFALFLSGTRGAIVGYGVAALVCIVIIFKYSKVKKKLSLKKIACVLGCFVLGFVLLLVFARDTVDDYSARVEKDVQVESVSQLGENRIEIWTESIKQGMSKPLFGLGISQLEMEINMGDFMLTTYDAHNRYIQIFATQGLFGLLSYLGLICYVIYHAAIIIRNKITSNNICVLALFMAFMSYILADFFCIGTYALAPYSYLIMGLILAQKNYCRKNDGVKNE